MTTANIGPKAPFDWDAAADRARGTDITQKELDGIIGQLSESSRGANRLHAISHDTGMIQQVVTEAIKAGLGGRRAELDVRVIHKGDAQLGGGGEEFPFPPGENPVFKLKAWLRDSKIFATAVLQTFRPHGR